jgi:hypothetical protein
MENIKNVCQGIEVILLDIYSKGIDEIDNAAIQKLEELVIRANELKMITGETLIKEFIMKYKKYDAGEIDIKEMAGSLMALDFYIKNITEYGDRSEL